MADIPSCPTIGADGVYGTVSGILGALQGYAGSSFVIATEGLQNLGALTIEPIPVSVNFTTNDDWFKVVRPDAPTTPDLVWDPDFGLLPPPPTGSIPTPTFAAPPTFTATAPQPDVHTPPGPLTATPPDGPPALDPVTVPDAPPIELPDFPQLLEILPLPVAPDIELPTFQGVRPDLNLHAPPPNFGFTAQDYEDGLLDRIKAKLEILVNGGVGLPAEAVQQMRDRAFVALDEQQARAEKETLEDFGARGWSAPDGSIATRLAMVRQNGQNQRNALARDVYLKDVDTALEQLRFGVSNGIALEGQLMNTFVAIQGQKLDAAKAEIQIAIDVFNAQVGLARLELELYQADAAVFRDLIQASLAKLEVYKAELEGKKLIGELNQQQVQVYTARVNGLLSLVELYKAQVAGAEAKAQVNLTRTQAFLAQVQAFGEEVKAYEVQWDAYAKQLEGDVSLFRRYELETNVFGKRVDIWRDINTNKIDQAKLLISERELDLSAFRARQDRVAAVLAAESARFDAVVRFYQSKVAKYQADGAIEGLVADVNGRQLTVAIEQERSRVQTLLEVARTRIAQQQENVKILEAKYTAIGNIAGTLSAGAMSAMHVSAGIESRLSQSFGCSTSFNYSIRATPDE